MKKLLCVLALSLASAAFADPADEVRCREIAFSISAETRDAVRFASFLDDDARFVAASVSRGPQEIVAAWKSLLTEGGPSIKWRPQIVEVLEEGTLALSRGIYRYVSTDEQGDQTEHWGTFNSIWRRQADGSWKVVFDAGSPAAEEPSEETMAVLEQDEGC